MKSPRDVVVRIQESDKIEPWCKRLFLFMHSQEVQCNWTDILKWNKAALWNKSVMTQKQRSPNKRSDGICSFVVVAKRQLPQLQGAAKKALSTLNASLKKYGVIFWFIIIENKVFVLLSVCRATRLLKDIEAKQIHSNVIESLRTDLGRANPRFKSIDSLVVTFCPSDILEIGGKSNVLEMSKHPPITLDVKVSSQTEDTHSQNVVPSVVNQPENVASKDEKLIIRADTQEEEVGPFAGNQPVEEFSKTSGQKVVPSVTKKPENVLLKDEKLSVKAESQVEKVGPFSRKQPVEVFSKTLEQKVDPPVVNQPENVLSKDEKLSVRAESKVGPFARNQHVEVVPKTSGQKVDPPVINQPENVLPKDAILRRAESQVGKVAPFAKNQSVEVFSKTSGQWVKAQTVCVQEDSEGIFVSVRRIDCGELDYDIKNVRAVMPAQNLSDNSLEIPIDDAIGESITDMQNEIAQEDDLLFSSEPESDYSQKWHAPEYIDDAARELFIPEHQHIRLADILSDAEWFERIETFFVLDKIRTIKRWLYGRLDENEQLPEMISENLKELSEMIKDSHIVL